MTGDEKWNSAIFRKEVMFGGRRRYRSWWDEIVKGGTSRNRSGKRLITGSGVFLSRNQAVR